MTAARNTIISLVLAVVAAVFYVAGTATCRFEQSKNNDDFAIGIFKNCGASDDTAKCEDKKGEDKDICQKRDAIRAFAVMACLFAGILVIWLVVVIASKQSRKIVTVVLFALAFITGIIAMAIGADMHDKYFTNAFNKALFDFKLDAGFACFVIGWVVSLVGTLHAQFLSGA